MNSPPVDPGWKPAIRMAAPMLTRRREKASILLVMRASVVLLSGAAGAAGLLGLVMSAASDESRIDGAIASAWLAADGALVIFGVGTSILLMAVAAPSADRIRAWQEEVDTVDAPYSVLEALLKKYEE